jgi:hypothetical protein
MLRQADEHFKITLLLVSQFTMGGLGVHFIRFRSLHHSDTSSNMPDPRQYSHSLRNEPSGQSH